MTPGEIMRLTLGVALAAFLATSPARAAFPGENGRIVFSLVSTQGGRRSLDLWAIDPRPGADGTARPVRSLPVACAQPCEAPHGGLLAVVAAFSGLPHGHTEVAFLDPRTWALTRKTHTFMAPGIPGLANRPAWSPEGGQIAFQAQVPGAPPHATELRLLDLTGTRTLLADVDNQRVAWSPDDRTLAFSRHHQIWLTDPVTGQARPLTRDGSDGYPLRGEPRWSPDGQWLAYSRQDGPSAPWRLCLRNLERSEEVLLTGGTGHATMLDWSPDGRKLLYLMNRVDGMSLWLRDAVPDPASGDGRLLWHLPPHGKLYGATWCLARPRIETGVTAASSAPDPPGAAPGANPDPDPEAGPGAAASAPQGEGLEGLAAAALAELGRGPTPPARRAVNGDILFSQFEPLGPHEAQYSLFRIACQGGAPRAVFRRWPAFPILPFFQPTLAPDGRTLACPRIPPGNVTDLTRMSLRIVDLPTDMIRFNVTAAGPDATAWNALEPAWASGNGLAFLACPGPARHLPAWHNVVGTADLKLLDAHGSRTLATQVDLVRPAMSPDGTTLAFCRHGGVFLVNVSQPQGAASPVVGSPGHLFGYPAWSPDGLTLALVDRDLGDTTPGHSRPSGWQLRVFEVASGQSRPLRPLSRDPLAFPIWSPEGDQVVFARLGSTRRWELDAVHTHGDPRERCLLRAPSAHPHVTLFPCAWQRLGEGPSGPAPAASPTLPPVPGPHTLPPPAPKPGPGKRPAPPGLPAEPPAKKPRPDA